MISVVRSLAFACFLGMSSSAVAQEVKVICPDLEDFRNLRALDKLLAYCSKKGDQKADSLRGQIPALQNKLSPLRKSAGELVRHPNLAKIQTHNASYEAVKKELQIYVDQVRDHFVELGFEKDKVDPLIGEFIGHPVRWKNDDEAPAEIDGAVERVIDDPAWPERAKDVLFTWKNEPPSGPDLVKAPEGNFVRAPADHVDVSRCAGVDPAANSLIIYPSFSKLAQDQQKDIVSFELGKLIWHKMSPALQAEFRPYINSVREMGEGPREEFSLHLPHATVVNESPGTDAVFAKAYSYFLFDRGNLPAALEELWKRNTPNTVLESDR
jgi:hypothetical protein